MIWEMWMPQACPKHGSKPAPERAPFMEKVSVLNICSGCMVVWFYGAIFSTIVPYLWALITRV